MLEQEKSTSNHIQIWLAVIGLIGALGGAVIANWDKFGPQPDVPAVSPASMTLVAPVAVVATEIRNNRPTPEPPTEPHSQPRREMPTVGPSFDCAKATYRSERLICSSSDLAVLDLAMANAYRDAVARAGTRGRKAALRDLQNHWLRRVREACVDVDCLKDAYEQQISELNAVQP